MAEECAESTVSAASSSGPPQPPSWWPDLHGSPPTINISPSAWSSSNNHHGTSLVVLPWQHRNPSSGSPNNNNNSCEEGGSMSASPYGNVPVHHSGLGAVDSSRPQPLLGSSSSPSELIGEHLPDHHLWSHMLLVGSNGDLQNTHDMRSDSPLDYSLSSKTAMSDVTTFDLEPPTPCNDYLKKLGTGGATTTWDFPQHTPTFPVSTCESFTGGAVERLTMVSNWSIAPPDDTSEVSLPYGTGPISTSLCGSSNPRLFSCKAHDVKVVNNGYGELDASIGTALFQRSLSNNSNNSTDNNNGGGGYGFGMNASSIVAGEYTGRYYGGGGMGESLCVRADFEDDTTSSSSFGGRLGKRFRSLNLSDCKIKPPGPLSASPVKANIRAHTNFSEGKKKKLEEGLENCAKKPKHESSTVSSSKMQVTKVKLGDRITALQQIVSPFGKTDTASVLMEAIGYIKFLQEQVRLLVSHPYLKVNPHKDPWGGLERKEKVDLRSRGLCLVPISCTKQVYRENAGTDYWTPPYRGVLYR